jgi:hypothetical protein
MSHMGEARPKGLLTAMSVVAPNAVLATGGSVFGRSFAVGDRLP